MPLKLPGGYGRPKKRSRLYQAPGGKTKKGRKHRTKKGRKGHTTKGASAKTFHEQTASTAGVQHPTTAGLPFAGVGSAAGAAPRPVVELSGLSSASTEGLSGALLDLVGEGKLTVAHALAAWTHEQNRLANRAWRRPGGLQRMGGL